MPGSAEAPPPRTIVPAGQSEWEQTWQLLPSIGCEA
jgi:hypothetical protein